MLPEFLDIYRNAADRDDLIRKSLSIEGIYFPGYYSIAYDGEGKIAERHASEGAPHIIKRRYLQDMSRTGIKTAIITSETEFSECISSKLCGAVPGAAGSVLQGKYTALRESRISGISPTI